MTRTTKSEMVKHASISYTHAAAQHPRHVDCWRARIWRHKTVCYSLRFILTQTHTHTDIPEVHIIIIIILMSAFSKGILLHRIVECFGSLFFARALCRWAGTYSLSTRTHICCRGCSACEMVRIGYLAPHISIHEKYFKRFLRLQKSNKQYEILVNILSLVWFSTVHKISSSSFLSHFVNDFLARRAVIVCYFLVTGTYSAVCTQCVFWCRILSWMCARPHMHVPSNSHGSQLERTHDSPKQGINTLYGEWERWLQQVCVCLWQ